MDFQMIAQTVFLSFLNPAMFKICMTEACLEFRQRLITRKAVIWRAIKDLETVRSYKIKGIDEIDNGSESSSSKGSA